VFVALPVALVIGGAALVAFIWAARDDQFEDLDTPPSRALFDDLPAEDRARQADRPDAPAN
jgi:cbb3-type cytochrome oxidase maturation protein